MTTHALNVLKVVRDDLNGESLSYTTLLFSVEENVDFSFSYDNSVTVRHFIDPDDESGGVNSVEYYAGEVFPNASIWGVIEQGVQNLSDSDLQLGLFDLEWGGSNSTRFFLLYDEISEDLSVDYIIIADGVDFPTFADVQAFDDWFDANATGLFPVLGGSGAFAPGTVWGFEDTIDHVSSSENDEIQDIGGHDQFRTGLGEDTIQPLWGDDVIDMGDEGGEPDWDTLDYSRDRFQSNENGDPAQRGISAVMSNNTLTITDSWGDTDIATGVEQLQGTAFADYVETDASGIFFRFRGFEGDDVFVGHADNIDSIDYRREADFGGGSIVADFRGSGPHTIIDGFNDTDTVSSLDEIRGSDFADIYYDGTARIRIRAEDGNDTVYGSDNGKGRFEGGAGDDTLSYELLDGGDGVKLRINKGLTTGGNGRDEFDDFEIFIGSQYRDVFAGTNGADEIYGGDGNDIIRGLGGADMLYGDDGEDEFIGTGDDEYFSGGGDNDLIRAKGGEDEAYGDGGDDVIRMGVGNDYAAGGSGEDRIFGDGGNDELWGGADNDFLDGGRNIDILYGEAGDDVLRGGAGADTLVGGAGDDRLVGGDGADVFVFEDTVDAGRDDIADWEDGRDILDLTDYGFASFAEVFAKATDVSATKMRIDLTTDNKIVIEGLQTAYFDASDVILTA